MYSCFTNETFKGEKMLLTSKYFNFYDYVSINIKQR
jgi:hypothetical protein